MAKVGLDIGHGQNTFPPSKGVRRNGKGFAEYDANSRVARLLEKKLKDEGHTVVMAQPYNANDVSLIARTNLYVAEKVDLILSIHANANSNESANGYAAFYWHNDNKAKRLADLYENELIKQGFKLWGGSRPSMPTGWSNFHMCRVPAAHGVPSILLENGFMTNDSDFEWIFGDKKDEYAEKCATAAFNAAQNFLGEKPQDVNSKPVSQPSKPSTGKKSISQMADEVIAQKHGNGHDNRRKSLGISAAEYEKVRTEVNRKSGLRSSKPAPAKPKKSIAQMATEVINNQHGNGHDNRRRSLGISTAEYEKVRAEVNRRAGGATKSPAKSVDQMAREVLAGKHGNGHDSRRKSLGISQAQYNQVRARVNQLV